MDWLHVADDLERQLLSKSLAASGNFEVVFVEGLADVGSRLLSQKPLIVSVRVDGGDEDLAALALRPDSAGTLIIASFMLPVREETSSCEYLGWEERTPNQPEWNRRRFNRSGPSADLTRWTWTWLPDWRIRLLKWVDGYIGRHDIDSLFSEQSVSDWLSCFDPRGEWFFTATDMMQLCRMGHHSRIKFPGATDAVAGTKLAGLLFSKENPSLIFHVKQLAEARWQRRELPWKGALPMETWLSLATPGAALITRDDLCAIANIENVAGRKKAVELLANRLDAGNPDALLASRLIKQVRRGYFDFQHSTLASLVLRDRLMRQITEEPVASWALACFDVERRLIVDAALDAVSFLSLVSVAERLSQEAPDSAVAIGAVEALFMAVARRIGQAEEISPAQIPALMSIAQGVLGRLDVTALGWSIPEPWTRPTTSQDEQLEWIAACWAWSLLPEPPSPISENWLFPGWSTSLPEPPHWLSNLWPDEDCEQLSPAWVNFFFIADQWVKDLERPVADAPRILKMALLGKAARGAWSAESVWWQELLTNVDHRTWVYERLLKRIEVDKAEVAFRLWPSFLEFERAGKDRIIVRISQVRRWLLEQLTPSNALDPLSDAGRLYLALVPESLPPEFRAPLLQALPKNALGIGYSGSLLFFRRFGPSAAPALVGYLDHHILSHAAATCLWEWKPESAVHLLQQKNEISAAVLATLIQCCPGSHLTAAVELLLAEPTLLDPWLRLAWARQHLITAGIHAEHLLEIIATVPPDNQ
ncbi:MAG: hypothetical protein ACEQSK_09055 [Sphingomonadaceae bacterium]